MAGVAVVLPGRAYDVRAPLLARAVTVLDAAGWQVRPVTWDAPAPSPGPAGPAEAVAFVVRHLREAAGDQPDGEVLVVAKSLGTLAASYAAGRGWPAVWLTPLLHEDACVAGLRASPAPLLLVGGTGDPWWDPGVARDLAEAPGLSLLEAPGADHGLEVGDAAATEAVRDRVDEALRGFAAAVVPA